MKKVLILSVAVIMLFFLNSGVLADTLTDVKKNKELICGVKDSTKPFGYIDERTRTIVGYDVDFCRAIAKKLKVGVMLKPLTSAARIPDLATGKVDIVIATMTKNEVRAKQVDFSYMYFVTEQKFLTKKGTVKSLKDLENKKIGTSKGSTSEQNAKQVLPSAQIISYEDYPLAFAALQQGKVAAVTTDASILVGLMNAVKDKDNYEIPNISISREPYGMAMRKGDKDFVAFVNKLLLEMESKGEAEKIYKKWFKEKRLFKITNRE